MIRRVALVLALQLAAAQTPVQAQTLTTVERAALTDTVRQLAESFVAAVATLDTARMMRLFSASSLCS